MIEDALIHLVNLSIKENKFSNRWKPQLIIPLHKKIDSDVLSNYRPICQLVQAGKIVEYAVYFQILEHFQKNNLFHPNHHGSLPNHSTATAIAQIFNMCLEAAENKQLSSVCMIDQSACFDLLSHKILKEKIQVYNFNNSVIGWLMSYLGNRTQFV